MLEPRGMGGGGRLDTRQPVMSGQFQEGHLEGNLARARRPAARSLDLLQAVEMPANVDQHACRYRADGRQRAPDTLLGCGHIVAHLDANAAAALRCAPVGGPVDGDARPRRDADLFR